MSDVLAQASAVGGCAARTRAAATNRGIPNSLDNILGLFRAVDTRDEDPRCSGVKGPTDEFGGVSCHAYQRRCDTYRHHGAFTTISRVTSLQNLDQLPTVDAMLIVAPLQIVDGTASPSRVFALVRESV